MGESLSELPSAPDVLYGATADSVDGLISSDVGPFGDLRELRLEPAISARTDARVLAAEIMEVVRAAATGTEQWRRERDGYTDERTYPGGADLLLAPVLAELDRAVLIKQAEREEAVDAGLPVGSDDIDHAAFRRFVAAVRDGMRGIRESATSEDGDVSVSVDATGRMLAVSLTAAALEQANAARLADTVTAVARRAVAASNISVTELIGRLAPEYLDTADESG